MIPKPKSLQLLVLIAFEAILLFGGKVRVQGGWGVYFVLIAFEAILLFGGDNGQGAAQRVIDSVLIAFEAILLFGVYADSGSVHRGLRLNRLRGDSFIWGALVLIVGLPIVLS